MISKAQKVRLGIFITLASTLLLITLLALSLERFLKKKDIYHIAYTNISVTGLDVGSSVKYLGINVGSIKAIEIDKDDISKVIVTIGIKQGTPIKTDVYANISTIGITGIKMIELRGGTNEADLLQPEGYIHPGTSLTEDFTGKAEDIANKAERLLNNLLELTNTTNRQTFNNFLDETATTVKNVNNLISDNRGHVDQALIQLDTISTELTKASKSSRIAIQEIATIVSSDSFKMAINNLVKITNKIDETNIYNLIEQTNEMVEKSNNILAQTQSMIKENRALISQSVVNIQETILYLKNAARQIDEDPSVLLSGSHPEDPPDDEIED